MRFVDTGVDPAAPSLGTPAIPHERMSVGPTRPDLQVPVLRKNCRMQIRRTPRTRLLGGFLIAVLTSGFVVTGPALADEMVTVQGRGFGHGVGMAQDGAYWMGVSGRSSTEILRLFFPGATLAKQVGTVRVPLASGSSFAVGFPSGGFFSGARVPAGRTVTVSVHDGQLVGLVAPASPPTTVEPRKAVQHPLGQFVAGRGYSVGIASPLQALDPAVIPLTTLPPSTTTEPAGATVTDPAADAQSAGTPGQAPVSPYHATTVPAAVPIPPNHASTDSGGRGLEPSSPTVPSSPAVPTVTGSILVASSDSMMAFGGRLYRGDLEFVLTGPSARVVNELDVEDYLRGMGEILTPSWPAATLQAQAIAARTYALRYMATSGEICPTQRCQVYLGAQAEYPAMDAAVAATRSKVLVFQGKLIAAFYSASGGGTIASPAEAFGGDTDIAYLQPGVYPTGDLKSWTVSMSLGEVARRVGYRGAPSGIAITEVGPSGRALTVSLFGTAGTQKVAGPAFDRALGLRSTFFTFGAPVSGGALAGPVGPRIPSGTDLALPGDLPSANGDAADASSDGDAFFAQADLLSTDDPDMALSGPDRDPGDPAGADASVTPPGPVAETADGPSVNLATPDPTSPVSTSSVSPSPVSSSPVSSVSSSLLGSGTRRRKTALGATTPVVAFGLAVVAAGVSLVLRARRRTVRQREAVSN